MFDKCNLNVLQHFLLGEEGLHAIKEKNPPVRSY